MEQKSHGEEGGGVGAGSLAVDKERDRWEEKIKKER